MRWSDYQLVEALKSQEYASVINEPIDKDGNTLLHIASTPKIVEILLKNGADLGVKNAKGKRPTDVYVSPMNFPLIQYLEEKYKDTYIGDIVEMSLKNDMKSKGFNATEDVPQLSEMQLARVIDNIKHGAAEVLPVTVEFSVSQHSSGSKKTLLSIGCYIADEHQMDVISKMFSTLGVEFKKKVQGETAVYSVDVSTIPPHLTAKDVFNKVSTSIIEGEAIKLNFEKIKDESGKIQEWDKSDSKAGKNQEFKKSDEKKIGLAYCLAVIVHHNPHLKKDINIFYHAAIDGKLSSTGIWKGLNEIVDKAQNLDRQKLVNSFKADLGIDIDKQPETKTKTTSTFASRALGSTKAKLLSTLSGKGLSK